MVKWNKLHYQKHGLLMGALFWSLPPLVFIMTVLFGIYGDTIVKEALTGAYSEQSIQLINTAGVTLRARHVESDINALQNTTLASNLSVVLARGLRSNLNSWLDFGEELTREGRDTWLIELTGGPGQDCVNCVNYNYTNLTQQYFPALIAHVLNKSREKTKIQYVSFSNACRVGLDSMSSGYLNPSKVDTFVAVGCPGAFEGDSLFAECLQENGREILDSFKLDGIEHPSETQLAQRLAQKSLFFSYCYFLGKKLEGDSRISRNLGEQYLEWIQNSDDPQPGQGLNLNNFTIIYGTDGFGLTTFNNNDFIVTKVDEVAILSNVVSSNKGDSSLRLTHEKLPEDPRVKQTIKEALR